MLPGLPGYPTLTGFIGEILGLLHQRGDALAERVSGAGASRGAEVDISQFLRLQTVNRFDPLFAHLATMQGLHPETFYQIALQLALRNGDLHRQGQAAAASVSGLRP